jgi:hypothetical protein
MTSTTNDNQYLSPTGEEFAQSLERSLMDKHGPLMTNEHLSAALGYRSMAAFRQALMRNTVPIPVFGLPRRRGKFAFVKDVARWLAQQHEIASSQSLEKPEKGGQAKQ